MFICFSYVMNLMTPSPDGDSILRCLELRLLPGHFLGGYNSAYDNVLHMEVQRFFKKAFWDLLF